MKSQLIKLRRQIVSKYRELAEVNQYKRDTKIGKIAEFSFIQGAIAGNPALAADPILVICLSSGRSILSLALEDAPEKKPVGERIYCCAVPCITSNGDNDFWFVKVRVPEDYEDVDEDPMSGKRHHHQATRIAALNNDCDVGDMSPVYDDACGRWEPLLQIFEWDTANTVDLTGTTLESA